VTAERRIGYGDVLRNREFRALYFADLLSVLGDYAARIAMTVLVYQRSGSPLLAAAAYAIAFLPWLVGGPLLSPLADRLPHKRVMLVCDFARMLIVAAMALPGMPLWSLLALLFAAGMLSPPFEAARSANLPDVLTGGSYLVGLSLSNLTMQPVQVAGFLFGGSFIALVGARQALLIDALTFAASYLLISMRVAERPAGTAGEPQPLLSDAAAGVRQVFANPVLRSILLLAWVGAAFAVIPEGLAVTYADAVGAGSVAVGVLMAADPLGLAIAAVLVGRFASPVTSRRLMVPLAAVAMLPLLVFALVEPPVPAAALLLVLSGAGMAYQLPANAAYVAAVPRELRGRAFALAQSGLQVFQGLAILVGGFLAEHIPVARVFALAGLAGLVGVLAVAARWPEEVAQGAEEPLLSDAAQGRALEPAVDRALPGEHALEQETEP